MNDRLLDDGLTEDASLWVKLYLTLCPARCGEVTKSVIDVVGTDPKLAVFRAME